MIHCCAKQSFAFFGSEWVDFRFLKARLFDVFHGILVTPFSFFCVREYTMHDSSCLDK